MADKRQTILEGNTRFLGVTPTVMTESTPRGTGPLDRGVPWVIEFRIVGTPVTMQVQVKTTGEMLIGRSDAEQNFHPEIDLLDHKGFAYGVSRRHARVFIKEDRMYIKDLSSTNGTLLNGALCDSASDYRLRHGDELTLGRMKMQVHFAVVPNHDHPSNIMPRMPIQPTGVPVVGKGQTVMVVEDDLEVGHVLRMGLEQAGFQVSLVGDAAKALSLLSYTIPDAIVLDIMLPDMNGFDLMRYIRKVYHQKHIPLVVVSGSNGGYQMQQALEAGADAFLGKPVAVEELVRLMADAIRK